MNISDIKNIKSFRNRLDAYEEFGYHENAKKDPSSEIRYKAYCKLGVTDDKALRDRHWAIRLEYYETFGFTLEALEDEDWSVRYQAYNYLGFTKHSSEVYKEDIVQQEYFEKVEKILGENKFEFNEDEANLLMFNGLPVNPMAII